MIRQNKFHNFGGYFIELLQVLSFSNSLIKEEEKEEDKDKGILGVEIKDPALDLDLYFIEISLLNQNIYLDRYQSVLKYVAANYPEFCKKKINLIVSSYWSNLETIQVNYQVVNQFSDLFGEIIKSLNDLEFLSIKEHVWNSLLKAFLVLPPPRLPAQQQNSESNTDNQETIYYQMLERLKKTFVIEKYAIRTKQILNSMSNLVFEYLGKADYIKEDVFSSVKKFLGKIIYSIKLLRNSFVKPLINHLFITDSVLNPYRKLVQTTLTFVNDIISVFKNQDQDINLIDYIVSCVKLYRRGFKILENMLLTHSNQISNDTIASIISTIHVLIIDSRDNYSFIYKKSIGDKEPSVGNDTVLNIILGDPLLSLLNTMVKLFPDQEYRIILNYLNFDCQSYFYNKLETNIETSNITTNSTLSNILLLKILKIIIFQSTKLSKTRDFHWKVSLSLISKQFFQWVSVLISEYEIENLPILSRFNTEHPYCLLKKIKSLDSKYFDLMEKNEHFSQFLAHSHSLILREERILEESFKNNITNLDSLFKNLKSIHFYGSLTEKSIKILNYATQLETIEFKQIPFTLKFIRSSSSIYPVRVLVPILSSLVINSVGLRSHILKGNDISRLRNLNLHSVGILGPKVFFPSLDSIDSNNNGSGGGSSSKESGSGGHAHSIDIFSSGSKNGNYTPIPKMKMFSIAILSLCDTINSASIFPYVNFMVEDFNLTGNEKTLGFLSGLVNGNVAVSKTMVGEITDSSNQARAFTIVGLAWSVGAILAPLIGGVSSNVCKSYPKRFDPNSLLCIYPYLLPNIICAVFSIFGFILVSIYLTESKSFTIKYSKLSPRDSKKNPVISAIKDRIDAIITTIQHIAKQVSKNLINKYSKQVDQDYEEENATQVDDKDRNESGKATDGASNETSRRPAHGMRRDESFLALVEEEQDLQDDELEEEDLAIENPRTLKELCFDKSVLNSCIAYAVLGLIFVIFDEVFPVWSPLVRRIDPITGKPSGGGFGFNSKDIGVLQSCGGVFALFIQLLILPYLASRFGMLKCFRMALLVVIPSWILLPEISRLVILPAGAPENMKPHHSLGFWFLLFPTYMVQSFANEVAFIAIIVMISNSCLPKDMALVNSIGQGLVSVSRTFGPVVGSSLLAFFLSHSFPYPLDYHFIFVLLTILTVILFIFSFSLPKSLNHTKEQELINLKQMEESSITSKGIVIVSQDQNLQHQHKN
eukprot:gene3076-3845_t